MDSKNVLRVRLSLRGSTNNSNREVISNIQHSASEDKSLKPNEVESSEYNSEAEA